MSKGRVDWLPNGRQSNIMRSVRFNRPIVVTRHAAQRMAERSVPDALLLRLIDEGDTRYSDESHLWAWLNAAGPARHGWRAQSLAASTMRGLGDPPLR